MSDKEAPPSTEKAQAQVAAVEAVAARWSEVITECQEADPRWILDPSVTILISVRDEVRRALASSIPPEREDGDD